MLDKNLLNLLMLCEDAVYEALQIIETKDPELPDFIQNRITHYTLALFNAHNYLSTSNKISSDLPTYKEDGREILDLVGPAVKSLIDQSKEEATLDIYLLDQKDIISILASVLDKQLYIDTLISQDYILRVFQSTIRQLVTNFKYINFHFWREKEITIEEAAFGEEFFSSLEREFRVNITTFFMEEKSPQYKLLVDTAESLRQALKDGN